MRLVLFCGAEYPAACSGDKNLQGFASLLDGPGVVAQVEFSGLARDGHILTEQGGFEHTVGYMRSRADN